MYKLIGRIAKRSANIRYEFGEMADRFVGDDEAGSCSTLYGDGGDEDVSISVAGEYYGRARFYDLAIGVGEGRHGRNHVRVVDASDERIVAQRLHWPCYRVKLGHLQKETGH